MEESTNSRRQILLTILILLVCNSILFILVYRCSGKAPEKENDSAMKDSTATVDTLDADSLKITIAFTGDIMLHETQLADGKNNPDQNWQFGHVFTSIDSILKDVDLMCGNFETVTDSRQKSFTGYPRFNSPKKILEDLANAGFDLLQTANNHCLDQGLDGLVTTHRNIRGQGMIPLGTAIPDSAGPRFIIRDINGIRLALTACTYGVNGLESLLTPQQLDDAVCLTDTFRLQSDLTDMAKRKPDFRIVMIHWGIEYRTHPMPSQVKLARMLFDYGADLVIGTHPHVIQSIEERMVDGKKRLVCYSLGNFLSNQRKETTDNAFTADGAILQIQLWKNKDRSGIGNVRVIPTWVERKEPGTPQRYRIVPLWDDPAVLSRIGEITPEMIESRYRTAGILGDYLVPFPSNPQTLENSSQNPGNDLRTDSSPSIETSTPK